jgi:type IV pilus assembly protein PilY1
MNTKSIAVALALTLAGLPAATRAQSTTTPPLQCTSSSVTENFTGAQSTCTWNFKGGACLTAGSTTSTTSPGNVPSCAALSGSGQYYNGVTLKGGNSGNITQTPDTVSTGGALRLTNNSGNESGAIISNVPFGLAQNGLQVTFTTETYAGDGGSNSFGGDSDGADGISFFLQDASAPSVTLGDFGGSLGYTCSNTNNSANQGYDGMVGAYIGLGIDEFGNFLDGSWVTNSDGSMVFNPSNQGANPQDNTASGYGKRANRIGLRGAGNVAWSFLSTDPRTSQYYPLTLTADQRLKAVRQTCETGFIWDFTKLDNDKNSSTYTPANAGSGSQSIANPYYATPMPNNPVPGGDYGAILNAFKVLSTTNQLIANESAKYRGYATSGTSGSNYGIPITYNLTITPAGYMSLAISYNGGNFQPVITGQQIQNGPIPDKVRFGFAGSTGGSNNIHEIMCFQAQPQNSASSSAGLNQKQTAKVQTGTQVYFAFYNSSNWTGSLTSQYLDTPANDPAGLQIDPNVNWDAACVLTGSAGGTTCPTTQQPNSAAEDPDSGRVIWSWNGDSATPSGIPFTWSSTGATPLSTIEQGNLNFGDPAPAAATTFPINANSRLEYLRGVRTDEQTAKGVDGNPAYTGGANPSGFRARSSILGDIIDSSPTWVGPPSATFPATWRDSLYPTATVLEAATTAQTYATFKSNFQGRTNVVYAGANDGFLHGFRSGYFNNGTYVGTLNANGAFVGTNNDGQEVLAYMPGYVVNSINSAKVAGTTNPNLILDYSSPQYAHRFSVDGTPGTGDLFYGGQWHTWLVGGLGAGGSAIYALEVTDPSTFTEANAAGATPGSGVIGEWSTAITSTSTTNTSGTVTTTVTGYTTSLSCANNTACGGSLGKTYGTPQIRRFHNGSWGAVFGNGGSSFKGDAGIYVMIANNSGPPTFYYFSTGVGTNYTSSGAAVSQSGSTGGTVTQSGTPNGIYFVSPADLDGDHVTDYVYAGDLLGNVWRFDLTSSDPTQWAVTSAAGTAATSLPGTPIYSTGSSSTPITTQVIVASAAGNPNPRILVQFGTGKQTQPTNNGPATYATSQQYLIGVWDWNLNYWNSKSTVQYASLPSGGTSAPASALSAFGNLQTQSISATTYDASFNASTAGSQSATNYYYRTVSNSTVCWPGSTTCTTGQSTQYGWYMPLTSGYPNTYDANGLLSTTTTSAPQIYEQVIFNPTLVDGAFLVNTTIPPTSSLAHCNSTSAGGWTMAINPTTGGAFTNSFFGAKNHSFLNVGTQTISGIALSGTGSPAVVMGGNNTYMVTQTVSGTGAITQINPPGGSKGSRVTWIEKR